MPVYNYDCDCGFKFRDLNKTPEPVECPNCSKPVGPATPAGSHSQVMETVDKYRNVKVRKNNERKLRDRMNRHHDEHELVDKIDAHGINDAEKFGWLKKSKKK